MKTKSLLLAAVAASLGTASAFGAVSSNIVGYTKLSLAKGLNLVANTLDNKAGNNITVLFAALPADSTIFRYTGASFEAHDKVGDEADAWGSDGFALNPGESVFVQAAAAKDITLVGEVLTGLQTVAIAKGNNFVASKIPQAGKLDTALGFTTLAADSTVFTWGGTSYVASDYLGDGVWGTDDGTAPTIGVGQGMVVVAAAASTWSRTFTVN
jgi:hypothetical protein